MGTTLEDILRLSQQLTAPDQAAPAPMQVSRPSTFVGLLGNALGGGSSGNVGLTQEQADAEGRGALLNFGLNMLEASGYSQRRRGLGEIFARGVRGAQGAIGDYESQLAARQAAIQQQQQQSLENRFRGIDAATKVAELQQKLQQLKLAGNIPRSDEGATSVAGGGPNVADGAYPTTQSSGWSLLSAQTPEMQAMIQKAAAQTGMPAQLLAAHKWNESRTASSVPEGDAGASFGIMQMQGPTLDAYNQAHGTKYTTAELKGDPQLALNVGAQHWMDLKQRYNGNDFLASMAYARGVGNTDAWIKGGSKYAELPPGVQRVLGNVYGPGSFPGATPIPEALKIGGTTQTASTSAPPTTEAKTETPKPDTKPPAGNGFGTTAFAPPTRSVMPAPPEGGGANAPVTTEAVPAVPTPQRVAAAAEARRTGKNAPIEGQPGLYATPQGGIHADTGLGRRADAGDALMQGAVTAATTVPPPSVQAAGPAAGGGATPATPSPVPPGAFGGGAFGGPAPQMVGATPAPVTPAVTSAATPAPGEQTAPAPLIDTSKPFQFDEKVNPPSQFMLDRASPKDTAAEAAERTRIEKEYRAARAAADAKQDPGKVADVESTFAQRRHDLETRVDARVKEGNAALDKARQDNYKQQQDAYQAAIQGDQTRQTQREKADLETRAKVHDRLNEEIGAGNTKIAALESLRAVSDMMGPGTALSSDQVNTLARMGVGPREFLERMGTIQAFQATANQAVTALKQGVALGNVSDRDMTFISNMIPTPNMSQHTRELLINMLIRAQQRNQQAAVDVSTAIASGVQPAQAIADARKNLAPLFKQVPKDLEKHWDSLPPSDAARERSGWFRDNMEPRTLYRRGDGSVDTYWGPSGPPPGYTGQ